MCDINMTCDDEKLMVTSADVICNSVHIAPRYYTTISTIRTFPAIILGAAFKYGIALSQSSLALLYCRGFLAALQDLRRHKNYVKNKNL
jgi:hypothetical protein